MNVLVSAIDDPYQPLSLPLWFEPAVGTNEGVDYEEYLRSDWIDAVKERVDFGDPGEEAGFLAIVVPPEMADDILVFNMTLTNPLHFEVFNTEGQWMVDVSLVAGASSHTIAVVVATVGGLVFSLPNIDADGSQWDLSIVIDRNVIEINFNGWILRKVMDMDLAKKGVGSCEFAADAGHVHAGWVWGTATPTQPDPPTTSTSTTSTSTTTTAAGTTRSTTGPGSGTDSGGTRAKTSVAMALLVLCFFR
eukprot:Polyplicarium_translucidae@DN2010_c0_g1_i1.p1